MNLWLRIERRGGPCFRLFAPEFALWAGFFLLLSGPLVLVALRHRTGVPLLSRAFALVENLRGFEIEVAGGEGSFLLAFRP